MSFLYLIHVQARRLTTSAKAKKFVQPWAFFKTGPCTPSSKNLRSDRFPSERGAANRRGGWTPMRWPDCPTSSILGVAPIRDSVSLIHFEMVMTGMLNFDELRSPPGFDTSGPTLRSAANAAPERLRQHVVLLFDRRLRDEAELALAIPSILHGDRAAAGHSAQRHDHDIAFVDPIETVTNSSRSEWAPSTICESPAAA